MLKKFAKVLLSVILVLIMGGFSIIEIGIELIYQIVRLIRRGYICLVDAILSYITPFYSGRLQEKICKDEAEEIKFYTFKY